MILSGRDVFEQDLVVIFQVVKWFGFKTLLNDLIKMRVTADSHFTQSAIVSVHYANLTYHLVMN